MSVVKGLAVDELLRRGSIKDVDVTRLRRALSENGALDRSEAEILFRINDGCPVQDPSWSALFIEAITDYIVTRAAPEGYVTADNAEWLKAKIAPEGKVESKTELELLASVLDAARWAPESLCLFVLEQVRQAVIAGVGPLRAGKVLEPGYIMPGEIDLVRHVLFAFGGAGGIAITRGEAELLFAIEDALRSDVVNPGWTDLFVKAITNALMSTSGHAVPTRQDALRRELWLEHRSDLAPVVLLQQMVRASLLAVWSSYREQTREQRAIEHLERRRLEIITNEEITRVEADWLAERLGRDGRLSANERALIAVLRSESPRVGPALHSLLGQIGLAA